jgi:GT2 family glycosyltransferase
MISIITVCHRSYELMNDYVASFLDRNRHTASAGVFEFVLVENSGDPRIEEHAETLRRHGFAAQVKMTQNHGFGAGCNEGAALARGRLLVFANPDMKFESDLAQLEEIFLGASWGTITQKRGAHEVYSFDLLPEYRNLATELLRTFRFIHKWAPLRRISYPIGSFFIVQREAFLDLDGFDERFFLYYEEAELSRRLQIRLGPPTYSAAASILHDGFGTQPSSNFTQKQEAKGMVTYANIIGRPELARNRVRMLRRLSLVFPPAAERAQILEDAICNEAQSGHRVGAPDRPLT